MSQQIYLPFGGQYLIPYEFDADTMQVPRGPIQCPLGTPRRESDSSRGTDLSLPQPRQLMEFRSNVEHVGSLSVKDSRYRDVA